MQEIKPMFDYVVIRRLPDKQIGRIHIPDNIDTKPRIGIVEAVGPGRLLESGARVPMLVSVGDRVSFSLESGFVSQLPGRGPNDTRLLIRETSIVAIIDRDAEASAIAPEWPDFVTRGMRESDAGD